MSTPETSPPRTRWSCCSLLAIGMAVPVLLVALLVGWVIVLHRIPAPPLVISESTTRVTGPLTAEGSIDFFKALEERFSSPELATDNNGYRDFVRLFGDVGSYHEMEDEDREFYRLQKYEKLGLDPDTPPTLILPRESQAILNDYYKAQGEEDWWLNRDQREPGSLPWTLEDYPMFADWVNEIDVPLDAIAEALRKPIFFFPLLQDRASVESDPPRNSFAILPAEIQLSRTIARIFMARAGYRLGQGNIDGAIDDKLTIHRLGRQMVQSGPVTHYLVGIAIEGMAWAIPVGGNAGHPLTEQQIRRLLDGLDALPPLPSFTESLERERYEALNMIQRSATDQEGMSECFRELSEYSVPNWLIPSPRSVDWNIVYRRINEMYDAAQEPSPRRKYALIVDEIENADWRTQLSLLLTPGGKNTAIANMFIAYMGLSVDMFEEVIHRAECAENMQRLALAILLYQHERDTMPTPTPDENWAVQIEKYLGENAIGDGTERYFSCPANPAPKGETRYAMILYDDKLPTNPHTLLLIELDSPVPFAEAVITADEVVSLIAGDRTIEIVEGECCGKAYSYERVIVGTSRLTAHRSGTTSAYRSGAVQFLSQVIAKDKLLRLLGREEESEEQE